MARSRPWLRLDANFMTNPLVRIAGCAAVYPWVLAVLKQTSNEAADIDLDPRICAIDLGLPLDIVSSQIAAMKNHGLIICGEDGNWRDPAWDEHQIDPRPMNSARNPGRPSANRQPMNPGSKSGYPEPRPGDSGTTPPIPVETRVARARLDRDIDIGQRQETGDRDAPPQRAARIQPNASASVPARPASPGGKWWERMGEEHGLGVIPTRQTGADGKPRWTFGGLKIVLQRLWPNEPVLQAGGPGQQSISRFIAELCNEAVEDIDRLLEVVAPHGVLLNPERLQRPYDLKHELARLKVGAPPGSRSGANRPGQSVTQREQAFLASAMAAERARLATVPDELWDLAQTMAAANEATDDEELRALIVGEYRRRNVAIPPVFRAAKASAA